MRTHVFVVNDDTFPMHLKYLFAGTGAGDKDENISLLSDIKRVRPNDLVVFYIEATATQKGGFYGIFRVADQDPLVFHTPGQKGFEPGLGKKLIYRVLIEPYEVYAEGVPEWEALDKLPVYATEIQWSLIYRKLRGKRGCTPLFPWEAHRLITMIRDQNAGQPIADSSFKGGFEWDKESRRIMAISSRVLYPGPRDYNYDVLKDIQALRRKKFAYEVHLQLYLTENIGLEHNLDVITGNKVIWFGNEVACGAGMQKIDILTINDNFFGKEYRIIEIKDEAVQPEIVNQIEYYVNWGSQNCGKHLLDAFDWNIQPVVIAPPHNPRNWQSVVSAFSRYNQKGISLPILYFEFTVDSNDHIAFSPKAY